MDLRMNIKYIHRPLSLGEARGSLEPQSSQRGFFFLLSAERTESKKTQPIGKLGHGKPERALRYDFGFCEA
jgi:hypothetical protein